MVTRDLAIVVTSMNEAQWLRALLPTIAAQAGDIDFEVVIADVESDDDLAEVVAGCDFARTVRVVNRGFAHANNVAALTTDSRYVLFLNADTELVKGELATLVAQLDSRPEVGLAGVRQVSDTGEVLPTIRRFATPTRALAEALWSERLAPSMGQRLLDASRYEEERSCDWTTGSFMLVRREALAATGFLDERFFFTAEEQDLCRRMRDCGWEVRFLPTMTIIHHAGKRGVDARFAQQYAFAEMQYARKHFGPWRRRGFQAALALNHGVRLASSRGTQRRAEFAALQAVLGRRGSPFMEPPRTALVAGTIDRILRGEAA